MDGGYRDNYNPRQKDEWVVTQTIITLGRRISGWLYMLNTLSERMAGCMATRATRDPRQEDIGWLNGLSLPLTGGWVCG